MPTGLYTIWDLDSDSGNFEPRRNKTRSFKNMAMSYFQRVRPQCKLESFSTKGKEKKLMHTVLTVFVSSATLRLKPWDPIIVVAYVSKLDLLSLRKIFSDALI